MPDRQDEKQREPFRQQLKKWQQLKKLGEQPDVDIWFADELDLEGSPRPRSR